MTICNIFRGKSHEAKCMMPKKELGAAGAGMIYETTPEADRGCQIILPRVQTFP